jgi:Fe-S cluster biogenesis protein NfuA
MDPQNQPSKPITDLDAIKKRCEEVLDRIKPSLHADGGDAEIVDLSADGVLTLKLLGACGGCAMAQMTLKNGIERVIKHEVPEITSVEATR